MGAEQTKKTVMALVKEVTEGTPVLPTAGTQYIALQEGFELEPSFEELENAELSGSIGASKSILGFESPTASLNHYLRHSGIEGQEPNYGLLLEGAFGTVVAAGVERDVVSATAGDATNPATVTVDAGEGVEYERGKALLIKDAVNGFNIRNVKSVAGDVLTLNFNLANAPAANVNLGRAILYKPGESHPSLSIWNFRGNGTALELISGAKITEMSIEVSAGELINGSFSLDGISYRFNPITVDATNNKFDGIDDGGAFTATIASATYKDPEEAATAIETAINAAASDVWTVTYDNVTGKFTIASDGVLTTLAWDGGANTATSIGLTIGFLVAADDTGSNSYVGDNALDFSQLQTPAFDDSDPLAAKANEVFLGDFADNVCFPVSTLTATISNEKTDVLDVCAESGKSGTIITGREVTVEMTATLERFDVEKFHRFHTNQETEFAFNFGTKSGGNWVPGKTGNMYMPAGTISSFKLADNDGLVTVEITIKAFVKSGLGEFYLNLL